MHTGGVRAVFVVPSPALRGGEGEGLFVFIDTTRRPFRVRSATTRLRSAKNQILCVHPHLRRRLGRIEADNCHRPFIVAGQFGSIELGRRSQLWRRGSPEGNFNGAWATISRDLTFADLRSTKDIR